MEVILSEDGSTVWRTRPDSSTNWAVITHSTCRDVQQCRSPWCWSVCSSGSFFCLRPAVPGIGTDLPEGRGFPEIPHRSNTM